MSRLAWNELPNGFKTLSNRAFTKELKFALFDILYKEDLHVKFDGITLKFKLKTNRIKKLKLAKKCVSSPPF